MVRIIKISCSDNTRCYCEALWYAQVPKNMQFASMAHEPCSSSWDANDPLRVGWPKWQLRRKLRRKVCFSMKNSSSKSPNSIKLAHVGQQQRNDWNIFVGLTGDFRTKWLRLYRSDQTDSWPNGCIQTKSEVPTGGVWSVGQWTPCGQRLVSSSQLGSNNLSTVVPFSICNKHAVYFSTLAGAIIWQQNVV